MSKHMGGRAPAADKSSDKGMSTPAHAANVIDALSDEELQQLCMCLPGRELLRFAVAAKTLHQLVSGSAGIWRRLTYALLGESWCQLHATSWVRSGGVLDTAFWRRLFRQGQELRFARWSADLRSTFLASAGRPETEAGSQPEIKTLTVGSGHCTVGIGGLVVKVGGLRPQCQLEHIHAVVFDLTALTMSAVRLTPDSVLPERRVRHAACEIRPTLTRGQPSVLVLGGCHDRTKRPCKGGLRLLHILQLNGAGCSGTWHSFWASGEAPGSIWHHICGSFATGKKVVVFGGDFNRDDPEFTHIADRSLPAGCVYVLDVDRLMWERVATSGSAPTWRSLHTGFTHLDISSHSERLVILGGSEEHVPIFSSSDSLAPMHGHALDLRSFRWLPQASNEGRLPPARIRLASEKVGEWLLLYGGHGHESVIGERAQLHKLNLRTLVWSTLEVRGRERKYPAAPAATMSAGLVLGGVKFTTFGIATVPKLDVLTLCGENDDDAGEDQSGESTAESSSSDEEEGGVAVVMRDASGYARRIVLPRAMLAMLMAHQPAED
mmetsp:Transcript_40003/g.110125  ORF Transcript_40003/g.110125 Transcript_40003/m.110125 type:complete len:550 (+) Transcript_40003:75-1724(+)